MVCCGNIECLPRMRGDRPHPLDGAAYALSFTPHARGSTRQRSRCSVWLRVYPACAGIDLGSAKDSNSIHSLPRMRGDRPDTVKVLTIITAFTPHARGSTPIPVRCCRRRPVYPACAGIDRAVSKSFGRSRSLPRMRGDRPWISYHSLGVNSFTPHARGSTCRLRRMDLHTSVYPACAGIDPV